MYAKTSSKLFQLQELVFQSKKKTKHFTNRWDSNLGLEVTVTVVYILHTSQSGLETLQNSQVL